MGKTLLLISAALFSVPAMAQPDAAAAPAQPAAEKPEMDRMICEKQEQIGTRLGARKVCKTARQWQEQRRIQREEVEKVQQNVNQTPSI